MDGSVDIKLLVTLGGIIVSMAGAAAVAKNQIQRLTEMLKDMEGRMRKFDGRADKLEKMKRYLQKSTIVRRLHHYVSQFDNWLWIKIWGR